jgi:hypothetical protein
MKQHRLRAPAADGTWLAEPPLNEASAGLAENRAFLERWDHDFQGRRAGVLRAKARAESLEHSRAYLSQFGLAVPGVAPAGAPWIVAGHQPGLFHAGVWAKNFALAGLARETGSEPFNLVVDNDFPKGSSIRVPHAVPEGLRTQSVAFDAGAADVPYEDLTTNDEALFESFADRTLETLDG